MSIAVAPLETKADAGASMALRWAARDPMIHARHRLATGMNINSASRRRYPTSGARSATAATPGRADRKPPRSNALEAPSCKISAFLGATATRISGTKVMESIAAPPSALRHHLRRPVIGQIIHDDPFASQTLQLEEHFNPTRVL